VSAPTEEELQPSIGFGVRLGLGCTYFSPVVLIDVHVLTDFESETPLRERSQVRANLRWQQSGDCVAARRARESPTSRRNYRSREPRSMNQMDGGGTSSGRGRAPSGRSSARVSLGLVASSLILALLGAGMAVTGAGAAPAPTPLPTGAPTDLLESPSPSPTESESPDQEDDEDDNDEGRGEKKKREVNNPITARRAPITTPASWTALSARLYSLGIGRDKVRRAVYAPFIIAGPASWTDTWGASPCPCLLGTVTKPFSRRD